MNEDVFFHGIRGLIRNQDGKFLMMKTAPKPHREAYWDIPGGRIERGSTEEAALKREIQEEVGISEIVSVKHLVTSPTTIRVPGTPTDFGLILSLYLCEVKDLNVTLSEDHTEFAWFEKEDCATKLRESNFPEQFSEAVRSL